MARELPVNLSERLSAVFSPECLDKTPAELSEQADIYDFTVRRILSGETKDPKISSLTGLIRGSGVTISRLLDPKVSIFELQSDALFHEATKIDDKIKTDVLMVLQEFLRERRQKTSDI